MILPPTTRGGWRSPTRWAIAARQTLDPVKGVAVVNEGLCKGCGACAATCRGSAIDLSGFRDDQILATLENL